MKKTHPLADLDADIRDHIERETQNNIEHGMSPEEAHYAARRKFGNLTLAGENTRAVWSPIWLDELRQDVRYALRMILRAPGFAAIAVGSSALGIGACAVIFAILNFAMLTPLPVEEPGRLISLFERDPRTGETGSDLSYPDFQDLRQARSFEAIAAHTTLSASLSKPGDPRRHWGTLATADYFSVVKPRFAIGRGFDPSRDDIRGAERVVVLSYDVWRDRFGRDPDIIGQTIAINARDATIVGVTAAGFRGTEVGFASEFWIPFSMVDELRAIAGIIDRVMANRGRYWLTAVGRLRPGIGMPAAQAELDVIARRLNAEADSDGQRGFHLERAGQLNPEFRRVAEGLFAIALGVTALVLAAACTNVGSLLLGRAWARRGEIAARMALGASRFRLIRQLLSESVLLASAGGLVALMLAFFVVTQLRRVRIPFSWPLDLSISLDARVVLFCTALSALTAIAFGLIPALRATRPDLVTDLKSDSRGTARNAGYGLRSALIVVQVAICTVLLVCMGLSLRSLQAASGLDVGVSNRNLLLLAFDPALNRRPDVESQRLLRDILDGAQRLPGVESATLTSAVPLTFIISNSRFVAAEHAKNPEAPRVRTDIYAIAPDFFRTMGIRFVAGEDFGVGQTSTPTTAIVNEAFARAAFPDQSPLGRRVLGDGKSLEIAGLVATAKSRTIGEADRPIVYLPILSTYAAAESPLGVTLVIRTNGEPSAYIPVVRDVIRQIDPTLAVFDVRTMDTHRRDALISPRIVWQLSFVAGCIGVMIALVGLYGVISFVVVRRRNEIGIRLAIGARPHEVLLMILKQGLMLASIGTAIGLLTAVGLTRFAASLLFGVSPRDAVTFAVVPFLLIAVALLACLMPARAAARLDPVKVLRAE